MVSTILWFIVGLVALIGGAELLVRSVSRLAVTAGISKLVIGLTVVAFGTSAPELAVSIQAGVSGQTDIMIGNIVGSNLTNILLILGLSALIIPLKVHKTLIKVDLPFLIVITILVYILGLNGFFTVWECLLLTIILAIYLFYLFRQKGDVDIPLADGDDVKKHSVPKDLFLLAIGFTGLILGARWIVSSAIIFAEMAGVSELVIGLTVVAIGTSLPEIVISLLAAFKGEKDIAVGNIVGSNILNFLAVLGVSGMFIPEAIPIQQSLLDVDLILLIGATILCFPVFFTGRRIVRWEGAVFLVLYIAYLLYQFLIASDHEVLEVFIALMLYFVFPMILLLVTTAFIAETKKRYRYRNFHHINHR
ncbi:MAG TPA: calcium/sodium antiporter [Balneolaceae bacterium]|nr:calcium/sodium antiporter [Balneolaceae bacterium]